MAISLNFYIKEDKYLLWWIGILLSMINKIKNHNISLVYFSFQECKYNLMLNNSDSVGLLNI